MELRQKLSFLLIKSKNQSQKYSLEQVRPISPLSLFRLLDTSLADLYSFLRPSVVGTAA